MIATNDIKNKNTALKSVKNTLFEMLGPECDGMESNKLGLIFGLNSERSLSEHALDTNNLIHLEDMSTADYNSSGKENKQKSINVRNDQIMYEKELKMSEVKRTNSLDSANFSFAVSDVSVKSAFNRVNENKLPSGLGAIEYLYAQYNMNDQYTITNVDNMLNNNYNFNKMNMNMNLCFHPGQTTKKKTLNNINNNNVNINNNSNNNNNQINALNSKQLLFTSTKNKKEKKGINNNNNNVNFQVIKLESKNVEMQSKSSEIENSITNNNSNNNVVLNKSQMTQMTSSTNNSTHNNSFREEYLDLLIFAAEGLLEKGFNFNDEINITCSSEEEKVNISPKSKKKKDDSCSSSSMTVKKCENRACNMIKSTKKQNLTKIQNFKGKSLYLCNGCNKAWKNGQYCYYCNIIYRENSTNNCLDNKSWIQCDYCELWQHIQCEEAKGTYTDISKSNMDPFFKYMCPVCRNNRTNTSNSNMTLISYSQSIKKIS